MLEIKTQSQLDKAIKDGVKEVKVVAKGNFEINCSLYWIKLHVEASLTFEILFKLRGTSRAELWGTSRAELWETSRAVLWGTSSAVLWETSSAVLWETSSAVLWGTSRAELWETSSAVLWGTSSAVLWGTSSAVAKGYVSLVLWGANVSAKLSATCHAFIQDKKAKVTGGKKTYIKLKTALDWCNYYGVEVKSGIAILYKSVKKDFYNPHNSTIQYTPGTIPKANDWDGGKNECGGGLHFSPSIGAALQFYSDKDARYIACPVKVSEMAIHPNGTYPNKCKAQKLANPCWEVDRNGKKI